MLNCLLFLSYILFTLQKQEESIIIRTLETTTQDISIKEIQKGKVYQSSLSTKKEKECFKYQQNKKKVLTFLVHGPNHKLITYIKIDNNDVVPTEENYDEMSMTSALSIVTDQFVACVQVAQWVFAPSIKHSEQQYNETQDWMNEDLYNEIQFQIVLYDNDSIIGLQLNQVFYGQIAITEQQKFEFEANLDNDTIFITKSILSSGDSDLKIYIGSMLYEELKDYEYQFFGKNTSSTFVLNGQKMKHLCGIDETNSTNTICKIFLVVKSSSLTTSRYTLTVHSEDLAIQLDDGQQHAYNLQFIEEYMHFYFIPANKLRDINVFAQSPFGKLRVHINIWENNNKKIKKYDWPFIDDEEDADISSSSTNQFHRTIKSDALEQCWPDCVILISVESISQNSINDYLEYNDIFYIMANQGIQDIVEGQRQEILLKYGESRYFTFKNLQRFRDDAYLTFSLLSLIGSGYFTMTVNGKDDITYPSLEGDFDFHSDGNYLQITKDQLNQVLNKKEIPFMDAYLIIEINGFHSYLSDYNHTIQLEFQIQYLNMDYIQIMHGSPHYILSKLGKPTIVQFYNYLNEDIFIKLHRLVGYGQMSIFICGKKNNIADCIRDSNEEGFTYLESIETVGHENSQILIEKNDKNKFCLYCTYIIKIDSIESQMEAQLTVVMENDFVKIPAGLQYSDYVEKDSKSQFTLLFQGDSEVEIIVQILYGDPIIQLSYDNTQFLENKYYKANNNEKYIHITIPSRNLMNDIVDAVYIPDYLKKNNNNNEDNDNSLEYYHLIHDELFVRITTQSNIPCNYTIYYSIGQISGKLQDGKVHLAIIQQNQTFLFEKYFDETILINLSPFNQTSLNDITIQVNQIEKTSVDDYHLQKYSKNISLKLKQTHPLSTTYELPKGKGVYEIILINNKYLENGVYPTQFIEISVNNFDIRILPYQKHNNGYLTSKSIDYFEAYSPEDGYLLLEINACQSDLKFGYTQESVENLIDEHYDEVFDIPESSYHIEQISVEKGTTWISIQDKSNQEAYYHITNHFYKSKKDIPFGRIIPGDEGKIDWTLDNQKQDSIQISFQHVTCKSCDLSKVQVNYHIFIAQDRKKLNMFGFCRNEQYDNNKASNNEIFKREPIQSYRIADHNDTLIYEIEFPNLITYEYAVVGVMATIDNFMNQTYQVKVFYPTTQVPVPNYLAKIMNKNRTFFTFIIVSMILLIALLTLWLCYYIKRYRNTQLKLDFQIMEGERIRKSKLPQNDDATRDYDIKMKYDTLEEDQQVD